jgi:hypothetical protein
MESWTNSAGVEFRVGDKVICKYPGREDRGFCPPLNHVGTIKSIDFNGFRLTPHIPGDVFRPECFELFDTLSYQIQIINETSNVIKTLTEKYKINIDYKINKDGTFSDIRTKKV